MLYFYRSYAASIHLVWVSERPWATTPLIWNLTTFEQPHFNSSISRILVRFSFLLKPRHPSRRPISRLQQETKLSKVGSTAQRCRSLATQTLLFLTNSAPLVLLSPTSTLAILLSRFNLMNFSTLTQSVQQWLQYKHGSSCPFRNFQSQTLI